MLTDRLNEECLECGACFILARVHTYSSLVRQRERERERERNREGEREREKERERVRKREGERDKRERDVEYVQNCYFCF
jgi:hypothetical protein